MLPDNKRHENIALTHFHVMAQLINEINELVKMLEVEMKKAKEQLFEFNNKNEY